MFRLCLLILCLLYGIECSCPSGYTLLDFDGICTHFAGSSNHAVTNLHSDAVNICKPDGATPVIIHNQQENDYWRNRINWCIPLGLRCNTTTKAWEWDDGSSIDYKNFHYHTLPSENCANDDGYSWYMQGDGTWYTAPTATTTFDVYCMTHVSTIVPPDDKCGDFMYDNEDSDCYQVGMSSETFLDAQSVCKSFGANIVSIHNAQENSFVRRLAVSRGLTNGILIGATISGKSDCFSWFDGSSWDYSNFEPGFPIPGLGTCLGMDTSDVDGRWVNVDCNQKAPFICKRTTDAVEPSCGKSAYTEGEIIYSDGFPSDASTPCDYFLPVGANKLVEVEILVLEANSCCDHLVLYDGSIGGNIIANLTGDVKSGTKYRTKTSNVMKVSWQPNGGVNVRGMMITFRAV